MAKNRNCAAVLSAKGESKIAAEECLVLYEKGSRGVIAGVYNSISEYADKEELFRKTGYWEIQKITCATNGYTKSTFCHHLNKWVVPRIRKRIEIENQINKNHE